MLCWKLEVRNKYLLLCAQTYVHAQWTPLFWLVHSKQVANFTGRPTFKCGKWQYKWWFFVYFWKIKGMNLQNNGVWRMVHHKLMYEPAPSGINNRSCTQSHSWTPNLCMVYLKQIFLKLFWKFDQALQVSTYWSAIIQVFHYLNRRLIHILESIDVGSFTLLT